MSLTVILKKILILILTLTFLITFPFLLMLVSPIYLYRFVVFRCSVLLRRKPGKMLSTKSSVFAVDTMTSKPKCTLLVFFVLDGHLELDTVKEGAIKRILDKKWITRRGSQNQTNQSDSVYPELKQYLTKWMGYYFWENEKHFSAEDHIGMYSGHYKTLPLIHERNVPLIANELINKPFDRRKSPWEVLLLHNVKFNVNVNIKKNHSGDSIENENNNNDKSQTLILLRVHHSLADGISLFNILCDLVGYEGKFPAFPKPRQTRVEKMATILLYPIKAPFEAISALVESYDVNSWHLPENELTGNLMSATSHPIPVEFIKEIKNLHAAKFMSVLLAALTGGIRSYMIDNNISVPENFHCLTPLPMPGHSEKLRNHFTAAAVRLPVGKPTPSERLQEMGKIVEGLKKSTVPATNYLFYPVIGGLLPCMARKIFKHTVTTAILSSLPAPEEKMHFEGYPVLDISYGAGLLPGNIGMGFSLLSYNGAFRIIAGGDQSIIPTLDKAQELVDKIVNEFYVIRNEFIA